MASKTHVRSAVVTACVNWHQSSSTVGAVSVKRGSDRRDRQNTSHVVPNVAGRRFSYLRQGPSNRWDDVHGLLIADKKWGVLQLVNDPRLQSLEYVEAPCGNYHPPVRLDWKEGRIVEGIVGTASGCTCAVRRWTPFVATWLPPVSMSPMSRSKCPKTGIRRGMTRGTPTLRGHGAVHTVGTAPARFPRVPHTLAIAVSPTAMDPTYLG